MALSVETALVLHLGWYCYQPYMGWLSLCNAVSLYPSIPQTECLQIVYEEMDVHCKLLLFDPNLIIKPLHLNMNNYYFLIP